MARRNRVDPWGDLYAVEARGLLTGNRGCLVDDDRRIVRHHMSNLWIACVTEFGGRRFPLDAPHRWTPLFFLDDAVALAAGHRPCGECRRADYLSYANAVSEGFRDRGGLERPRATALNRRLAAERLRRGGGIERARDRRIWTAEIADLPAGTVVVDEQRTPRLLTGDRTLVFAFDGWRDPTPRPIVGSVEVLTPPTSVLALTGGYAPLLHESAAR